MRAFPTAIQTHLDAGGQVRYEWLLWVEPRNRSTGAAEPIGFWTGDDHVAFTVGGSPETFYGDGTLLEVPVIVRRKGVVDQRHDIVLSGIRPTTRQGFLTSDPMRAPVTLLKATFNAANGALLADPEVELAGRVAGLSWSRGRERSAPQRIRLSVAGRLQRLTETLTLKKSDAAQRERDPADAGLKYVDVAGSVPVAWGDRLGKGDAPGASPAETYAAARIPSTRFRR